MAGILAAKDVVMEPRGKSSQGTVTEEITCFIFNCIGGMKGRRVLQYGNASLLKGKKIYLDLHGYKRASFIESGLRERGAVRACYDSSVMTCNFRSSKDSSQRIPGIS